MPDSDNTPEGWSSQDKFNAALETASLSEAEVAEYCRSQGINTSRIGPDEQPACRPMNRDSASNEPLKSATRDSDKHVKQISLAEKRTSGGSCYTDSAGKDRCSLRGGRGRMISLDDLQY